MTSDEQHKRVAALATASDPVRAALVQLASRLKREFTRDEAADALSIARATAAFQLDKLAAAGVFAVSYRRRGEKTGPGAGRPAKYYSLAVAEVSASIPERHYDLAAELLSAAIELADRTGSPVKSAMATVANERGEAIGRAAPSLASALESGGYEPRAEDGDTVLTNCPFHHLTASHTETICALNHSLLRGVVEGAGADPDRAEFAPSPEYCCVRIAK